MSGFAARLGLWMTFFSIVLVLVLTLGLSQVAGQVMLASTDAASSEAATRQAVEEIQRDFLILGLVASVLFTVLGWIVASRISRPLSLLAIAARRIQDGDVATAVPQIDSPTELAALTNALTTLVSVQVVHEREMKQLASSYERRISDHTAQLSNEVNRLERVSGIDALTGLANRRQFNDVLDQEWKRAARHQIPLSLIIGDIDHFKLYNDHYGHQGGDDCLKRVSAALAQAGTRSGDLSARYGGEEFAVILTHTESAGARRAAQRLLENVRYYKIPHAASPVSPYVSLSLGVACVVPDESSSAAELIKLADTALYKAKEQGRNRVVVAVVQAGPVGGG